MTYYDRSPAEHVDGSPIFANGADAAAERDVAALLERAWGVELRSFGALAAVDWYALRAGRLVGVLELKARAHPSDRFLTVFLNVRKWLALQLASVGLGVPAVFVVRFTDEVRSVELSRIDAQSHALGGCSRVVKSRSDVEPVILVPVALMRRVEA